MTLLSNHKNISFGTLLSYISMIVSMLSSFFVTPIILAQIGDSNYGLFSFCNSIISWLTLISGALGSSFLFFINKEIKENGTEGKTNTIFFKLLLFTSLFVIASTVISVIIMRFCGISFPNYNAEENNVILVLLLLSGANASISIFFSVFTLHNNYTKSFVFIRSTSIIISILISSFNVVFALLFKNIFAISAVSLVLVFVNGVVNMIYALKIKKMIFYKVKITNNVIELKSIIKYSSIILIGTILTNLDSNLDKTLLGIMINATSVTMYQLSISFTTQLILVSYSISEIMTPTIFELYRKGLTEEASNLYLKISRIQSILILFVVGGYVVCGYHFVILWIGEARIVVYYYSVVLFLALIVQLTRSSSVLCLRANNKHKIPTIISLLSTVANLIITIALLICFDDKNAVWACIIGTVVPKLISSIFVRPFYDNKSIGLPIKEYFLQLLKIFIVFAVSVVPLLFVSRWLNDVNISNIFKVLIEGFSFVLVYSALIFIFERRFILEILKYFKR